MFPKNIPRTSYNPQFSKNQKFKEPSTIPRGESNLICQSPRPIPLPLVHPQSKISLQKIGLPF
ncbi:hypothetical protein ES288_D11G277100v1 [Gossypium darwinii]|uniref:Uncharacterized protein n=1 Tax=Gossypium darwinii TaxID=34276 RepID=A0A5D2APB6_GOSDA|nr:hypothetical protein ES288_D11G277100v1 [Gossypium darwinii]